MKAMKINLILISLILSIVSSCKTHLNNKGIYVSTCYIQRYPDVILKLNEDKSFTYKLAYQEDRIKGNWERNGDTLFLRSGGFKVHEMLASVTKFTTYSSQVDAYLIKRKKLFPLDSLSNVEEGCWLKAF